MLKYATVRNNPTIGRPTRNMFDKFRLVKSFMKLCTFCNKLFNKKAEMPATVPIKMHISINNVRFGNLKTNRLSLIAIFEIMRIHQYFSYCKILKQLELKFNFKE